jgi:tetratricopeptide (TPR) repeat protein
VKSSARALAVGLAMTAAGCAVINPAPPSPPRAAAPVHLYALRDRAVALGHAASATGGASAALVSAGQPLTVEAPPALLSARHQARLAEANARYEAQNYTGALAIIEPAYLDERDNAFILEAYARILYRMGERAQSFVIYRELVDLLDRTWASTAGSSVIVDLWFVDAYWKLGTLHMTRAEWERAAFEISRALVGGVAWEPLAEQQALSYLTRAYYELGRDEEARYYAERALGRNPRNTYVRQYLDRLARGRKER